MRPSAEGWLWTYRSIPVGTKALPIRVNLTSNPFRDYCLTIKLRSPLAPRSKGGTRNLLKVPLLKGDARGI
ncbi:MAG: hypothetical protein EAZ78_08410 [Oscillatoriales cyanobacterium]|nr:MAG: hypothetical protein EA000_13665 [Oscillatoriales cyanobacterium]TAD97591.1 MAG: hypothetical protein EAZ98_09165 [Oscillatoriales cyanobacterium]TAE06495.1 MAG: hypothetical protein EAZ96_02040 [Oscillatoriales cyanobacterium]TAF04689.1 MAG: hypothetical protein EAZ78_08410 [Oscillatoriales cyanobacterium]TAF46500.1 MAG: hypothetical protein EAZ68_03520 [Oscillatoriales cyanobacterium]